jgi:ABC-type branched-subunit amino acid transport system substrate-binding protein
MAETTYHNFDLYFQREGDGYRVRADSDEGQAGSTFALPFSEMELENFLLTTRPGGRGVRRIDAPDVAAAKRFGGNLFDAVFSGDVQGCWRSSFSAASQEGTRLRVRLRFIDTPELADLPWEYLFSRSLNRFLALDDELAIVRYLDMPERTRPVAVTLPLRVLVMISNPADFPRLDVEQEWANMEEALAPLRERGLVQIDLLEDATLPALRKQLQANQYHILHFIGHGAFDRQTQEGVVVLKDENGRGRLVSGQHLGWLLHNYRTLALVILNACEGARADRTDAFAGTAQSLVQQGIPAAVAMQFEITDGAAKTFSHAFYTAVADGRPVENALFEARMGIFAEGHELEWATPVLYMRAAGGHLFDIAPGAALPRPETAPLADPVVMGEAAEPLTREIPGAVPVVEARPKDVEVVPRHEGAAEVSRSHIQQEAVATSAGGATPPESRGAAAGLAAAADAVVEAQLAEAQKRLTTMAAQPAVGANKSGSRGLPVGVMLAAGGALALVLLVLAVVLLPGLSGPGPASPTSTPEAAAVVDVPTETSEPEATDTSVASGGVSETAEPTATVEGAGSVAFDGTLKIGVDAPLTGVQSSNGAEMRDGAQVAVEYANDHGGVEIEGKRYSLELVVLDDAANDIPDPAQGLSNISSLIEDPDVVAMIGPFDAEVAIAEMPVLNNAGMAHIGVGSTNEALTKPEYGSATDLRPTGKITYFRVTPTNDIQGSAAADYMHDVFKSISINKVYVLDDGGDYGKNLADRMEAEFKDRGGGVVGRESVTAETTDLSGVVTRVAGAQPDAVYIGGTTGNNLGLVRKQMVEAGLDIPFMGADDIVNDEFLNQAGDAANGTYATMLGANPVALETAKEFVDYYQSRFNTEPGMYSAQAYEAASIIVDAMRRAGSSDRETVRDAIAATTDYSGILGSTAFDDNGDTTYRWVSIYQVQGGQWQFVDQFQYSGP